MAVNEKYVVGLTGGIGSGKSTVASLFAELGPAIVDTDKIAHRLTQAGGAAIPFIVEAFGAACIDAKGALDRAAMRDLVFSSPAQRHQLELILHPMIRQAADAEIAHADGPYQMLVVPLLFESDGYRDKLNRVLVIDCEESTQIARTMSRNNHSEETVRSIIASQASRVERKSIADDVINNDGDLDQLLPQIHTLHRRYLSLASENLKKMHK